jgi:hypothetical protein
LRTGSSKEARLFGVYGDNFNVHLMNWRDDAEAQLFAKLLNEVREVPRDIPVPGRTTPKMMPSIRLP